jgi:predicted amidophosphoribosyltransferase
MRFAIDPELKYCTRCKEEYRADIDTCAECGAPLQSGADLLGQQHRQAERPQSIDPSATLVDIRRGSMLQIKQVQALLARQHIPSLTVADPATCGGKCCGGPELLLRVREEDLDAATAVLRDDYLRTTGLSSMDLYRCGQAVLVGSETSVCPGCGHTFGDHEAGDCPDCGLSFG